jgi:hypothetical protein
VPYLILTVAAFCFSFLKNEKTRVCFKCGVAHLYDEYQGQKKKKKSLKKGEEQWHLSR